MAVQKKKKNKEKNPSEPKDFKWTPQRKKAAFLLSVGIYNNEEVAEKTRIHFTTLYEWKKSPIFLDEVDRLTLKHELSSKAGLLRLAYKAVNKKMGIDGVKLENDKNTVLDWAEFIVKILPEDAKDDEDKLNALADAIRQSAKLVGK